MAVRADLRERLVAAALGFPEATEDFPWGERVAKVNKKIFAFFGTDQSEGFGVTLKLPESCDFALRFAGVTPAAYGLGRAGWVRVGLGPEHPSADLLLDWLDESYRAVAPMRLIAALDATHRA